MEFLDFSVASALFFSSLSRCVFVSPRSFCICSNSALSAAISEFLTYDVAIVVF